MSKVQMLKLFVNERLTSAVDRIFEKFLTTIEDYEKELSRSREVNERQRKLLEAFLNPQHQLHRADGGGVSQLIAAQGGSHGVSLPDTQQLLDRKEDVPSEQQGRSSSPDQQDPEPPNIKEEQQQLGTNQVGEKLQELVIVDMSSFYVPVRNQRQPEENREAEPPVNILIEEIETESDGEDYGGLEPLMNLHPDRHLQPDTDDKPLVFVQSSSLTSVSESREPQSDLNSLEEEESLQRHMTFTHQADHMDVHTGEKQFSCHVCGRKFALCIQLRRHKCVGKSSQLNGGGTKQKEEFRRREATNACNLFFCPKCNKSFDDFYQLEKHLRSHIKGRKCFCCPFCGKSFGQRKDMMIHMRLHIGEKPLSCCFCYETFRWPSQVKNHTCSREKCLKLYQGPIEEPSKAELQGLEGADFTPVPVKSEDDEETPQSSQLHPSQTEENMDAETPASISTEQMKREDDGEDYEGLEPYSDTHLQPEDKNSNSSETDVSDGESTETRGTQSDLSQIYSVCNKLRPRKTKRTVRPFSCSTCKKAFETFRAMYKHKLLHLKTKPLPCPICCKTFPTMSHLLYHIVIHTGEKRLSCSGCYRRFRTLSKVKSHRCSREKLYKHKKSLLQKKREAELQEKSEDGEETAQSSVLDPSQTEENRGAETPASISAEQVEPETDGVDCGGSDPDPDRDLQPDTDDTTPEYGRDDDDRMKIPFNCSICGQKLSSKASLQKHILLHFKRKIFNCGDCDKTFSCYSEFLPHKNDKHPEPELEAGSISTEEMEIEDDGEDSGGSEPYLDSHLQPDTADTTPEYGRDRNDSMMIREPQTDLNCQTSNEVKLKLVYRCCICELKLPSRATLKRHMKHHFTKKTFKCGHCDKTFSSRDEFVSHVNDQSPELELEIGSDELLTEKVKEVKEFICPECGKTYTSQNTVDKHMEAIESKTYSCRLCSAIFCNRADYSQHKKIHGIEILLKCPQCDKRFSYLNGLKIHMKVHSTETIGECPLCPRKFNDNGSVGNHLKVHIPAKKPFICPFCKRSHTTRKRWILHMKTYVGQKRADQLLLKSE